MVGKGVNFFFKAFSLRDSQNSNATKSCKSSWDMLPRQEITVHRVMQHNESPHSPLCNVDIAKQYHIQNRWTRLNSGRGQLLVFCPKILVDFLMKPVNALFAQGVTTFLQLVIVTTKTWKNFDKKNMSPQEGENFRGERRVGYHVKTNKKISWPGAWRREGGGGRSMSTCDPPLLYVTDSWD